MKHPYAQDDEILIGNMFSCDVENVGWKTKRSVKPAYQRDGKRITTPGFVSVLVKQAEIEAAGVSLAPVNGVIDHRWVTKAEINCCVVSPNSIVTESVTKNLIVRENRMRITVELNPDPNVSAIAINQWIEWGMQIEKGSATKEPKNHWTAENAAKATSPKEKALFKQLLETQETHGSPELDADAAKLEAMGADAGPTLSDVEEQPQQPAGALPPGVEGPVKKKGGRPSKAEVAERERRAAEAAAQANPAMPTQQAAPQQHNGAVPPGMGSGGARPPGVSAPPAPPAVQAQQPAMPSQEEFSDGMFTKEDLRECYVQAVNHDPKGTRALMLAPTWPDGGETKPQWFNIEKVVPLHYDRLIKELSALIPMEV